MPDAHDPAVEAAGAPAVTRLTLLGPDDEGESARRVAVARFDGLDDADGADDAIAVAVVVGTDGPGGVAGPDDVIGQDGAVGRDAAVDPDSSGDSVPSRVRRVDLFGESEAAEPDAAPQVIRLDALEAPARSGRARRAAPGETADNRTDGPVRGRTTGTARVARAGTGRARTAAAGADGAGAGAGADGPAAARAVVDTTTSTETDGPDATETGADDQTITRGRGGRSARGRRGGEGRVRPAAAEPPADPVAEAKAICLRLLEARPRTRLELAQALRRKGVSDEAAEAALTRFGEVGLVDDAAFAGQWVRSRHTNSGLGRRAIAYELRRKGVDSEIAGEALAEVDAESEEARARALVARKLGTRAPDESTARRLVGMLARKGYPAGIAYRVVREALAEHAAELAEQVPTDDA